jgi:hypothetical protein
MWGDFRAANNTTGGSMKNKILFLGSLCLVMVIGLVFVGCQNEVQTVELGSVSAPKNVVAVWEAAVTSGEDQHGARLRVTWDAVSANDISGYYVVIAQENSKNWISLGDGSIIKPKKPTTVSGTTTTYASTYPDFDKYEVNFPQNKDGYWLGTYSGTFKFGVYAASRNNNHKKNSKVVWSKELVTVPVFTETNP